MSDLSVLDLQNLRHLIGGYDTSHCKMTMHPRPKTRRSKSCSRMPRIPP